MVFFCKCFISMFQVFQLFVLMLQVFYLDILKVYGITDSVFHIHILFVSYVFRHMLQTLCSDVSKVDRIASLSLLFLLPHLHLVSLSPPFGTN